MAGTWAIEQAWQNLEQALEARVFIVATAKKIYGADKSYLDDYIDYMLNLEALYSRLAGEWKNLLMLGAYVHATNYHPRRKEFLAQREEILADIRDFRPEYKLNKKKADKEMADLHRSLTFGEITQEEYENRKTDILKKRSAAKAKKTKKAAIIVGSCLAACLIVVISLLCTLPLPIVTVGDLTFEKYWGSDYYRLTDCNNDVKEVVIPSSVRGLPVEVIDFNAFHGSDITSIEIPNSITWIHTRAFSGCKT